MYESLLVDEKIDPRILRTRALLGQAFTDLVAEKGFQAISVQDITQKAGVNRTTFYLHFTDKYALLDYSIQQGFQSALEKRMLNVCKFSPENLHTLIVTVAEFIASANARCAYLDAQFEALVETQAKKQIQAVLVIWLDGIGAHPDANTAAIAASWAIYGLAQGWSHDKKGTDVEQFAAKNLPLILSILGQAETAGAESLHV